MTNYILNLHILDCENLIYNGQSANECNVFIRCHLQNYDNNSCQTKSLNFVPNPQFNEELKFCVHNPENDKLIIEVVRQDKNNENNLCSPIIFPLKTVKLGIMSVEKTSIPLKNEDQQVGILNIAGQMFSEDTPQILNSFSKPVLLRINIVRIPTIREQNANDTNDDIYLTFLLQGHDESEMIKCFLNKKSLNPSWNQSLSLICNDPVNDVLQIKMISGNNAILDKSLKISDIELDNTNHINLSFGEDIISEPLLINISVNNLNTISKNIVKVHIKILKGTDLMKMRYGKSNPYVRISLGDKESITDVQKSTINPEWNQEFDFLSTDPINDSLNLQLFHRSKKSAADNEMMSPISIPIKDLNLTSYKHPSVYDIPVFYKNKEAGHLSFEIFTEGENLIVPKKAINKYLVEFTLLETSFTESNNVNIKYALRNKESGIFKDVNLNQPVQLKVRDLQDEPIVYVFEDSNSHNEPCNPFIVNLKLFTVNENSEVNAETYLDDEKTGNIKIIISIREIPNKKQEK